ncbi:MAG: exonuclease domain-containing protein [Deltaproteobacteria bacterium]
MKLAIIDVETTGGSAKQERIIEFAVIVYDGKTIIDSYETLINPERSVPPYISHMTGITNEMLSDAPKFYEVAKKIIEITENCVFVAHNVRFDYSFVTEEYYNLGYTFIRKQLCTIKFFKKMFPGLKSYGLGNLIRHFNIDVDSRHRAMADVKATFEIMQIGLQLPQSSSILDNLLNETILDTRYPQGIGYEQVSKLPEKTGIYFFYNEYDEVIYIGKSINIKKRIKQHFQKINSKSNSLYGMTRKIDFELTGSELVACIREAEEIKHIRPELNKALKKSEYPYMIFAEQNNDGYITFRIRKSLKNESGIINGFSNMLSAKNYIEHLVKELSLCRKISGLEDFGIECLNHKMGECLGACVGEESPVTYNERILEHFENIKIYSEDTFAIIDQGRSYDEISVIYISDNNLRGYGFFNKNEISINSLDDVKAIITPSKYDKDFNGIVRRYLIENSLRYKIIT